MPNPQHVNPRTGRKYGWEAEQARLKAESPEVKAQEISLLERQLKAMQAREHLLDFTQFTMPDPTDPGDVSRSAYEPAAVHHAVADALTAFIKGELTNEDGSICKQLIFCMPPRHGKTALGTKSLTAWVSGRRPDWDIGVASYSDTMAQDMGADTRAIMLTPQYKQVFPEHKLRKGGTAKDNIQTEKGGRLVFVGRGGALTGRGMSLGLGDDLFKDHEEARSQTIRDAAWNWFTKVFMTRRMGPKMVILTMCMTGDTQVLMADGAEKMLRDIKPGDMIASYSKGRLVVSRIENHINNGPDLCYEIKMTSGTSVKANERHPFLVDVKGDLRWKRLRSLKTGDVIVRVSGANGKTFPANTMAASNPLGAKASACPTTANAGGPRVLDRLPTIRHLGALCGSSSGTALRSRITTKWSAAKAAAARFATSLQERMCARIGAENCALTIATRLEKSEDCCAMTATSRSATGGRRNDCSPLHGMFEITRDVVSSIEPVGYEDVFDVQVADTENFIANGLVSHNTRWHSDDIIGRITDPENPNYNAIEAKKWKIIRLPAIAEDDDPLGRPEGEPLWPERFDLDFLQSQQRLDPLGFAALYQQRPTVADGILFRRENIQRYDPSDLPDNLRYYCASDHAVGVKQRNDPSCFGKAGVDAQDNLWLVDLFWKRVPTDQAVEAMLAMGTGSTAPILWWAERGHISQSIGPFLRKRMLETGTYINVVEVTPTLDKESRAQSIAARVAMGKVYVPKGAIWDRLVEEMLAFPNGIHDDGVDMLSLFGLGLQSQFGRKPKQQAVAEPKFGSVSWLKAHERAADRQDRAMKVGKF